MPIVVATAAEHVRSAAATSIDAAGVLPKPFEVSDLLRLVARHVPRPPHPGAVL